MRSLQKRKASSANLNESSSSDDHSDGEYVPDPNNKSEDENPSNDEAVMTPKKKFRTRKTSASAAATKKTQVKSAVNTNCGDKKQNVTPDPDSTKDNEADRPIPTLNGGYSHTKKSRAKIGAANKGNTPWNKGKVRSEEDKAKISAGVKARCRAVLLAKLEKMGWTEDQWWEHKKKLKLQREAERTRRKRTEEREQLQKESLPNARSPEVIEQENKGKVLSEEVKAKISAGVKARCRAVLLAKLEKMGLTEDQWWAQKKKLKSQREAERNRRRRAEEREQLQKESLLNARSSEVIEQERLQIEEKEHKKNEEAERKKNEKENAIKDREGKAC